MKKLLSLLLCITISILSVSQTKLEQLLFKKICDYRYSKGLKCWTWDDHIWRVSNSHNNYQINHKEIGHVESDYDKGSVGRRYTYYNVEWNYAGENCAVINSFGKSEEEIAEKIIAAWIASPPHHKLLLSKKGKFGAVTCRLSYSYLWSEDHPWTYATLNVLNVYN